MIFGIQFNKKIVFFWKKNSQNSADYARIEFCALSIVKECENFTKKRFRNIFLFVTKPRISHACTKKVQKFQQKNHEALKFTENFREPKKACVGLKFYHIKKCVGMLSKRKVTKFWNIFAWFNFHMIFCTTFEKKKL